MRAACYKRVSTDKQDVSSQNSAISAWLAAHPQYTEITEYVDEGMSGTKDSRPAFQRLCADVRAGKVDAVVCFRLDRLSRNAITALQTLLEWMKQDVGFYAVDQPAMQLGRDNPFRVTIVAMFSDLAAMEREAIVSRVKAGLRAAKDRGVRLGKPSKITAEQRVQIRSLAKTSQHKHIAAKFGVSPSTISRICNTLE